MIRVLAAIALMTLSAPAFAQSVASPDFSPAEQVQLRHALDRGTLIYVYDQAAWHGTDDMLAKLDDATKATVGGWIVDGPAESADLVFYDKDAANPHAIYTAHFDWNRLVSSHVLGPNEDRALSPARRAMIAARNAASDAFTKSGPMRCVNQPFNTVVLPPEAPGGATLVYFLTPQTSNDSVPAGGHYRVEVSAAGKAGEIRPFTRSCIELSIRDESHRNEKLAGLTVTHLLDPVPTEIHVFTMLTTKLPLFVSTTQNGRVWGVEYISGRGRIRLLDPKTFK